MIPALIDPIYSIDGLSDKSTLGQLLRSLLGYNGNPALVETFAYVGYLGIVGRLVFGRSTRINLVAGSSGATDGT